MKTLFLTVGGSWPPLLKAIGEEKPGQVIFFCTGRDPATGEAGSEKDVPKLAEEAHLAAGQYQAVIVPADALDGCIAAMAPALVAAAAGEAIADYTGGTKTMGAALVLAALESPAVRLRFTGGARSDLRQVAPGTERGIPISLAHLRFGRAFAPALLPWSRFAYAQSELLLDAIPDCPAADQPRLTRALALSRAFAAWDCFDHQAASDQLGPFRQAVGAELSRHMTALKLLTTTGWSQTPARLWDLWRNAERRAGQARYDDALARWYRFTEGLAQWILGWRWGIETASIPPEQIPGGLELPPSREGQRQAGLYDAWRLLAAKDPSLPAAQFFADRGKELLGLAVHRNAALLAHGFTPVTAAEWQAASQFTDAHLLPLLTNEAFAARGEARPLLSPWPQLPDRYIFDAGEPTRR